MYDLIVRHKDRFKTFIINEIITSKGFDILRLPPYHPELNPIEKIWGILKNNVTSKNAGQNLTSIMTLIRGELKQFIASCDICGHVEDIENLYWQYFDMDNEFIIYVNDSDSVETDCSDRE